MGCDGCFGHLALPKLRQKNFIHGHLSTARADNELLKIRTHGHLVDPDLPHLAIEFLATLLAFKIDSHLTSIVLVLDTIDNGVFADCFCINSGNR